MAVTARARGYLELTRPTNAVVAGVTTFIGAFVAVGVPDGQWSAVAAAVGATVFAAGAGNAINDYFDREIDRVNRPDRPLPRGAVSPRGTLELSVALLALATVLALTLPVLALAIAAVNLLALIAYTELFKGLPGVGNVVVALLSGSTFLFGGAAVGRVEPPAILFVLAALASLTREIVKDVEDVEGDREEGLRTLPIAIGPERSLRVGAAVLVVAVLASPLPYVLGVFPSLAYLAVVVPADLLMLAAMARSFDDPGAGQRRLKVGMFLAAGAFIAGRVASLTPLP